jgi:outer membrane protein assembly factor BamB
MDGCDRRRFLSVGGGLLGTALLGAGMPGCGDVRGLSSRADSSSGIVPQPSITDWPCLFGATHDSQSGETDVRLDWPAAGPRELWRKQIGTGYSAPVVVGDALVAFQREGDEEIVERLDAATGESRWRFAYPTAYVCPYKYSNGPYGTPVIDGNRVFAWGAEGVLHCLNLADGGMIWQRRLSRDYQVPADLFAVASSPLVEGGMLILNVGGGAPDSGIVALDKGTGETIWTATADGASYATPCPATIHGQRHVFVFTRAGLVSIDPDMSNTPSGRVRWSIPFAPKNPEKINASSPIVHGDLVFVTGYMVGCLCIRVLPDGGCQEVWRDRRALDCQYNNLVCREGYLYGYSSMDRALRCLDLATGEAQWDWSELPGRGASPLAIGDRMLVLSEQGRLAALALDRSEARQIATTPDPVLDAPCFTSPALHRGRLYLRNETTLVCLDLRARPE